eukprot:TRINITY_DN93051_c0_g1_i1.p1 TRINITY_DN93051_c0_g1~~TRINITY_DN93051_c0_g1_i1.p1  ORF type:complete len:170 (+),score=56.52 TRINITY_DN93051_c0_g1_i1:42-551(+)
MAKKKKKGNLRGMVVQTTSSAQHSAAESSGAAQRKRRRKRESKKGKAAAAGAEKSEAEVSPAVPLKRPAAAGDVHALPASKRREVVETDKEEEDSGSESEESEDKVDPEDVKKYIETLRAFLTKHGKSHIGIIGRKVPKPEGLKLGKFFAKHTDHFVVDKSNGHISLQC